MPDIDKRAVLGFERRTWLLAIAAGFVVYILAWFGIELTRSTGRIASLWLSNAVLLAAALKVAPRQWAPILVLGYFGNITANLQAGDDPLLAGLLTACNLLEVLVAASLVVRFAGSLDFRRRAPLAVLLLSCAGPAPAASSLAASLVLSQLAGADFLTVAGTWYSADALGLIMLTPLLLVLDADDIRDLAHPKVWKNLFLVVAVLALAVSAIFLQSSMPLLFLAIPAVLIGVWMLGYAGAALGVFVVAVAAFVATIYGVGPISLMQTELRLQILALQGFVATAALTAIIAASVRFEVNVLRAALAQAPDFFYVKNLRSEFVAANNQVIAHSGHSSLKEMVGKTDRDLVPPERAAALMREENDVMRSGFPLRDRTEVIVAADGTERWYETTKVALRTTTDRIIGLAGITKDITFRKTLEAEILRSRDELDLVLGEMSDGIAVVSADGYIMLHNEQFQSLFPLTGPMRVRGAYFPKILQAAKDMGEQPNINPSEAMSKLKEGLDEEIHLSNGDILLARTRRRSKGGWVVVVSDISRIKKAELEIRAMAEKLEILAATDGLTGAMNRRMLDERLEREVARCRRSRSPISVVMVDIDHFKGFNDGYGHQTGDRCLQDVARALQSELLRPGDFVARYGGEEFCIVLPDTDEAGAFVLAERLRLAVRARNIPNTQSAFGLVTISSGVATLVHGGSADLPSELVMRADTALYKSKQLGRDRVTAWSFASTEKARTKAAGAA